MGPADALYWETDPGLFASLPGGLLIQNWFGFVPSFHDADVAEVTIGGGDATIAINAFRTTNERDERGFFRLDRHALVTIKVGQVCDAILRGPAHSTIAQLGIRRLAEDRNLSPTGGGALAGDFEVSFDTSYGLEGSFFGKTITLSLTPTTEAKKN